MIKRFLVLALAFQCVSVSIEAINSSPFFMGDTNQKNILVHNRILSNVNGKPISVIDVMKKMDLHFYRQFPQYASSVEARFQFYQMRWKNTLSEMLEKELILADAIENKVEISNGDIRQEIETLFGPKIIENLAKAGLSYDEAWKMIKEDQTIKRMIMMRVNSIAFRAVTPKDVRDAYSQYAKENETEDSWKYQVISFRGEDTKASQKAANLAHVHLTKINTPVDKLQEMLEKRELLGEKNSMNISMELEHGQKEISDAYQKILSSLEPAQFSQPVAQDSQASNGTVYRIFYLKELIPGTVASFQEVETTLRNKLLDNEMQKESANYIAKMRKRFNVKEEDIAFADDYQPFTLN